MGLALCGLAFAAALILSWRSQAAGLGVVLTAGYFFGILRANLADTSSYFIFDAAVLGFFLSYFGSGGLKGLTEPSLQALQRWVIFLIGLPVLMFLLPLQHPLVQLVGLRANVLLLPFILVGARLNRDDANGLALWLSLLNHVAMAFAVAEYVIGVPAFYPLNDATQLIYRSTADVAGSSALRIPATFGSAHTFGGTMICSLPWLLGAWAQPRLVDWQRMFLLSGTGMAIIGVFMCAARLPIVILGLIALIATFSGHLRGPIWVIWSLMIAGVIYLVSGEERMQRFASLQQVDVLERIQGSVNMTFVDLLLAYPFGNGIGAGGTSIPGFLQVLVKDPVIMESEYSRILLEQGVAGLVLWGAFVVWFLGRRPAASSEPWLFGRRLMWFCSLAGFAAAAIGLGLMSAIPQSMLFFLGIGFAVGVPVVNNQRQAKKELAAAQEVSA